MGPVGSVPSCVSGGGQSYAVYTDSQLNSANLIETVPLGALGLNDPVKISYYTLSFTNLTVDLGPYSNGAPIDAAPDNSPAVFDPNNPLYSVDPAQQTVTTDPSSTTDVPVSTSNTVNDLEVGTLAYYQNNDPANLVFGESSATITRVGYNNLLLTYLPATKVSPLVAQLKINQYTAFLQSMQNYHVQHLLTDAEYLYLLGLFHQLYP